MFGGYETWNANQGRVQGSCKILAGSGSSLVGNLPKNLGFATGIDFRETNFLLSAKNAATLKEGMFFCLNVGFQDVELSEEDRSATPDKCPVSFSLDFALHVDPRVHLHTAIIS